MNWITQQKRLLIYLRDGCACMWCGKSIECSNVQLSLDHVVPHSEGGCNCAENLITCCSKCNSIRQNKPIADFVLIVAGEVNVNPDDILQDIDTHTAKDLTHYLLDTKELIARRGTTAKAIQAIQKAMHTIRRNTRQQHIRLPIVWLLITR